MPVRGTTGGGTGGVRQPNLARGNKHVSPLAQQGVRRNYDEITKLTNTDDWLLYVGADCRKQRYDANAGTQGSSPAGTWVDVPYMDTPFVRAVRSKFGDSHHLQQGIAHAMFKFGEGAERVVFQCSEVVSLDGGKTAYCVGPRLVAKQPRHEQNMRREDFHRTFCRTQGMWTHRLIYAGLQQIPAVWRFPWPTAESVIIRGSCPAPALVMTLAGVAPCAVWGSCECGGHASAQGPTRKRFCMANRVSSEGAPAIVYVRLNPQVHTGMPRLLVPVHSRRGGGPGPAVQPAAGGRARDAGALPALPRVHHRGRALRRPHVVAPRPAEDPGGRGAGGLLHKVVRLLRQRTDMNVWMGPVPGWCSALLGTSRGASRQRRSPCLWAI